MSGVHEATSRGDALQEAPSREAASPVAAAQEGVVLRQALDNANTFTKHARAQEGVEGAQAVQEGAATSPEVPAQAVAAPAQAAV